MNPNQTEIMHANGSTVARPRVRLAVRRSITLAAVSALSVGVAATAMAAAETSELETVVVTGSRIARPVTESTNPVQVISSEAILDTGQQNVQDILEQMPAVGTSAFDRSNSNFASFGNGLSTLNLRNMGDSRTLVLINGRRVVSGLAGDSTVDTNNIPTDLLESVEVLTGGASAVYGSEAIAGAVNFRLKNNFTGLSVRAQTGMSGYGDDERYMVSVTGGMNVLDSGNVAFNITYDKDSGLHSADRGFSAHDNPFKSSYVPQGWFNVPGDSIYTFNPDNTLKRGFSSAVDGFDRNQLRYLSVPLNRLLVTGLGDLPITDSVSAFFEASYSQYTTNSSLEPQPSDNSDATTPSGDSYAGLTVDNPFIPATIRNSMIANDVTNLPFRKRWLGIADRSNFTERDFQRYVGGFKGKLADKWNWEAYFLDGQSADHTASDTGYRTRYFFALDAVTNPLTGQAMCRDATARAAGCAPMNLFGFNSVSQASIDYVTANGTAQDTYDSFAHQQVMAANITGSFMDLPAGAWSVSGGVEYRKESAKQEYNPETQAGNTLGNALSNTSGKYDVKEVFVETVVPLVKDVTAIHSLDVEAAYRYGDYSTVGGVSNWKVGLNWAPVEGLRFRGVYSNASRAPNISELFGGQNQTFPSGIDDPCNGIGTATAPAGTSAAVIGYCRALPGFAANVALPGNGGVFTSQPNTDVQSYQGFDGGNPNLKAETAKTWTVGMVLTPTFLPNFALTVDWFDIKIDDAIALVPRDYIVNTCAESGGTSDLCNFITREPAAPVRPRSPGVSYAINSGPINAAQILTSGVDVTANYIYAFANAQRISAALSYTYLDKLSLEPIKGQGVQSDLGQLYPYASEHLGSGFRNRAVLSLGYQVSAFNFTWRMNYLSDMVDTLGLAPDDPDYLRVGSYVYHNMQARYSFGQDMSYSVYFGADNVFNKKPPVISQSYACVVPGFEHLA